MSDHLPECNEYTSLHPSSACICAVIHAHGMKVMSATIKNYEVNDYALGYNACKRDIVNLIDSMTPSLTFFGDSHKPLLESIAKQTLLDDIDKLSAVYEDE